MSMKYVMYIENKDGMVMSMPVDNIEDFVIYPDSFGTGTKLTFELQSEEEIDENTISPIDLPF